MTSDNLKSTLEQIRHPARHIIEEVIPPDDRTPAFEAGYKFVERMIPNPAGGEPYWFGWAIRAAFWAGVEWARAHNPAPCVGAAI